jgi:hypothetical protein
MRESLGAITRQMEVERRMIMTEAKRATEAKE